MLMVMLNPFVLLLPFPFPRRRCFKWGKKALLRKASFAVITCRVMFHLILLSNNGWDPAAEKAVALLSWEVPSGHT